MTPFEQTWYDRYMKNMVTVATLNKLVAAGKLEESMVNQWVEERKELLGY